MDDYIKASEIAESWNVSACQVQILCKSGKVEGAIKFGTTWAIPKNAKKPTITRKQSFGRIKVLFN